MITFIRMRMLIPGRGPGSGGAVILVTTAAIITDITTATGITMAAIMAAIITVAHLMPLPRTAVSLPVVHRMATRHRVAALTVAGIVIKV